MLMSKNVNNDVSKDSPIAKYFEQGKELKLQFLDFHALLA